MRLLLFLFILPCTLSNYDYNQNQTSVINNSSYQRVKRFSNRKAPKTQLNRKKFVKDNHRNAIARQERIYSRNYYGERSQSKTRKAFTRQVLAEIKRILSKQDDDYYGILNIDKYATPNEIIRAYRKLIRRVHPDKVDTIGATLATQRLNKARHELLKNFESQNQGI